MKSEQWMVSQGDAQSLNPEVVVIQESLSNLYIQINQSQNVLHVALYIMLENALLCHLFIYKGLVIRKVIGVPDSYVVEVDGHRYHRNKCDLTLSPPDANNNDNDESDSDNNQADHNVPMARGVIPTLHPRPQLKFSKLPVQATQQKDFDL